MTILELQVPLFFGPRGVTVLWLAVAVRWRCSRVVTLSKWRPLHIWRSVER